MEQEKVLKNTDIYCMQGFFIYYLVAFTQSINNLDSQLAQSTRE